MTATLRADRTRLNRMNTAIIIMGTNQPPRIVSIITRSCPPCMTFGSRMFDSSLTFLGGYPFHAGSQRVKYVREVQL